MPRKLDPALVEIFKKYDEPVEGSVWDCHGTWVAYHKAVERIAAKANIKFDMPQIIESNTKEKTVAIAVQGHMGERSEWSFGEAAPGNNKNSYPYAMAEKRAKDRVVLKLIGLSGLVYSEEESDDFKGKHDIGDPPKSSAQLKRETNAMGETPWEEFTKELEECQTTVRLKRLKDEWREKAKKDGWNKAFLSQLAEAFQVKEEELKVTELNSLESNGSDFPGDPSYHSTLQAG